MRKWMTQGTVSNHWTDGGVVDMDAVRDYAKAEADGYGTLTGVKARSQVECDATTKKEKNSGGYLQYYVSSN
ncbi:MAG: hypothetical protein VB071_06250 [Lawsonibacter sp.]|nr:hypothetical protein [Lawsonibacter sp.]